MVKKTASFIKKCECQKKKKKKEKGKEKKTDIISFN